MLLRKCCYFNSEVMFLSTCDEPTDLPNSPIRQNRRPSRTCRRSTEESPQGFQQALLDEEGCFRAEPCTHPRCPRRWPRLAGQEEPPCPESPSRRRCRACSKNTRNCLDRRTLDTPGTCEGDLFHHLDCQLEFCDRNCRRLSIEVSCRLVASRHALMK